MKLTATEVWDVTLFHFIFRSELCGNERMGSGGGVLQGHGKTETL